MLVACRTDDNCRLSLSEDTADFTACVQSHREGKYAVTRGNVQMMLALLYVRMQLIVHTLSFGEVTVHLKCYICSYTQSMKLAGESLLPCTACEHLSCMLERNSTALSVT